jgi:hypothetical protein
MAATGEDAKKGSVYAPADRERVMSDVMNTGVTSALISGFALNSLSRDVDSTKTVDILIYLTSCLAIHMCTCACLASAMLYRKVNMLKDDCVKQWAADHSFLLHMPMSKFLVGCVCYLASVVLQAWKDLAASPIWQYVTLGIGVSSVMMVFMTTYFLVFRRVSHQMQRAVAPASPNRIHSPPKPPRPGRPGELKAWESE